MNFGERWLYIWDCQQFSVRYLFVHFLDKDKYEAYLGRIEQAGILGKLSKIPKVSQLPIPALTHGMAALASKFSDLWYRAKRSSANKISLLLPQDASASD